MIRRPTMTTRTVTPFPYPTLFLLLPVDGLDAGQRYGAGQFGGREPARADAWHGAPGRVVALGRTSGAAARSRVAGTGRRAALAEPGPCDIPRRTRPFARTWRQTRQRRSATGAGRSMREGIIASH